MLEMICLVIVFGIAYVLYGCYKEGKKGKTLEDFMEERKNRDDPWKD